MRTALFVVSLLTTPLRADDVTTDLKKLQGVWRIESEINDGKAMPAEEAKKIRVTYADDGKWKVEVDGTVVAEGTTVLNPTAKPKTLDYTVTRGDERGSIFLGIYELHGETFRHCGVTKGHGERPTDFSSKPGSGRFLVTFKRVSK